MDASCTAFEHNSDHCQLHSAGITTSQDFSEEGGTNPRVSCVCYVKSLLAPPPFVPPPFAPPSPSHPLCDQTEMAGNMTLYLDPECVSSFAPLLSGEREFDHAAVGNQSDCTCLLLVPESVAANFNCIAADEAGDTVFETYQTCQGGSAMPSLATSPPPPSQPSLATSCIRITTGNGTYDDGCLAVYVDLGSGSGWVYADQQQSA